MKKGRTERGFQKGEFKDYYDAECSIQQSSLADAECIWLGIDDAAPQIMASDAIKLGFPTGGAICGWVPFEIPKEVLLSTRMHLERSQVEDLVESLQAWLKTGEI